MFMGKCICITMLLGAGHAALEEFCIAVNLLQGIYMLVQEVADMLFQ